MPDVIRALGGAMTLFDGLALPAEDVVARVRERFERLHDLPQELREDAYRELLESEEYQRLKARMDLWCALWFWPPGDDGLPTPRTWAELDAEAAATLDRVVAEQRFFHWEIEFPDVFGPERAGFDAVLGNPPWEVSKPNSKEFFSRHDPLYRSYGKTEALGVQRRLFGQIDALEERWLTYQGGFKSMSNVVKVFADPFEASLGAGTEKTALSAAWAQERAGRPHLAGLDHPYRLQGSADLNTYKLFLEASYHLLADGGRLGMLVPSGIYTDKGTTELRRTFLETCTWEWCYGFENRAGLFPIHRSFKFVPNVIQRGGETEYVNAAFMRHDVAEWERPEEHSMRLAVNEIERFSPSTWSFMELKGDHDLDLVDRIYAQHPLLGEVVERLGGAYSAEFHMTNDSRMFVSRPKLQELGLLSATDDLRDPRVRAQLRAAGYLALYEGKSFWIHNPYFLGARERESVSKCVTIADVQERTGGTTWQTPRLCMRNVASSTNQRTYIVGLMPACTHGNSAPTLDGLTLDQARSLKPILASLVIDYIVRMKVSANLNWFYLESIPIADWRTEEEASRARDLTWRLNALGADFGEPADDPIVDAGDRMWARLVLDALVASSYGLHPDDLDHIASQFPIYDRDAPEEFRYPKLAAEVFRAAHEDGAGAAEVRGKELIEARRSIGCGFGLDEVWEPSGGWQQANLEAKATRVASPTLSRGSA